MDLISVVVPVYNVEKYLEKCVESIVNQTYQDLEIILVDDGSPDRCPQMCDEWAKKDSRIKVIHKENGGLSSARNAGIKISSGKYLIFIDSDDYISLDCIESLFNALGGKCQIAVGGLECVHDGIVQKRDFSGSVEVVDKYAYWNEYYKSLFTDRERSGSLINGCCKLFEASFFDDIEFPIGKVNEDTFTTYKIFDKAKNIAIVNRPLYFYEIRQTSISHVRKKVKHFDILDALRERLDYFIAKKNKEMIKYAFIDLLDNQIERYLIAKLSYENLRLAKEVKKSFVYTYKQAKKFKAFQTQLYKKRTFIYHLFYINEYLFRAARKIVRKLKIIN